MRIIGIAGWAVAILALAAGCEQTPEEGTPFVVIASYPANQETNVPISSLITIRSTHPVDYTTVLGTKQVIVVNQQNSIVPVSITFNGELMVLTPGSPLAPNATYGVAVRPGVRDVYGANILPYAFTFATGSILGVVPNWPPFTLPTLVPPAGLGPSGTFTPVSPLWVQRARHTSHRLNDGRTIVIGGESSPGFTVCEKTAEIFDPSTLQWALSQSNKGLGMFYDRAGHTSTMLPSGRILVIGGTPNGKQAHPTAEIYDPSADSFTVVRGMLGVGRMFHAASILPNGNVLVSGGATSTISNTGFMVTPLTDTIEVYDANSGTFQMSTVNLTQGFLSTNPGLSMLLVIGFIYQTATLLPDSSVLLTGGLTFFSAPAALSAAMVYHPDIPGVGVKGYIRAAGSTMMNARAEHRATLIPEGDGAGLVLITGGLTTTSVHMSAELYDYNMVGTANTRKGIFRYLASNLSINRRSHTVTYIPSSSYAGSAHPWGKLLVAGGSQRIGTTGQQIPYPPHVWPFVERVGCGGCQATDFADIFDPFQFGYKNPTLPFLGIDQTGQFQRTRDPQGNLTVIPQNAMLGRYWHTAEGLANGSVLISGGYDCVFCIPGPAEGVILSTCSIYNP
jgi:hypothetical protein